MVIEAIRQIVERRLDPYFPKGAHGYRASKVDGSLVPYTGHEGISRGDIKAVALSLSKGASSGFPFVSEGDVVSAFTGVNRDRLRDLLKQAGMINDEIINLILRCCGTHLVGEAGEIKQVDGIAMGSPISPLIWTLYSTGLHTVLPPKGERTEMDVLIHSYADNFWIQGSSAEAVCQAMSQMNRRATLLGLTFVWDSAGVVDLRTLEGDPNGYQVLKQNKIQVRKMDKTDRLRFEVSENQTGSPTKRKKVSPTARKEAHRMGHKTLICEKNEGRPIQTTPAKREQEKGQPEINEPIRVGAEPFHAGITESPDGPSRSTAGNKGSAINNREEDSEDASRVQPSGSEVSDLSSHRVAVSTPGAGEDGCSQIWEEDSCGVGTYKGGGHALSLTGTHMGFSSRVSEQEGLIHVGLSSGVLENVADGPNRFRGMLSPSSNLRYSEPFLSGEEAPQDGYRALPVAITAVPLQNRSNDERGDDEGSVDLVPLHLDPTTPVARLRAVWRSTSARWKKAGVRRVRVEIPLSVSDQVWPVPGLFGQPETHQFDSGRLGDDHWQFKGSEINLERGVQTLRLEAHPVKSKKQRCPKPSRMVGWHVVVGRAVGRKGSKRVHVRVVQVRDLRDDLHPVVAALNDEDTLYAVTDQMSVASGGVEQGTAKARALLKALNLIPRNEQPLHLWGVPMSLQPSPDGSRVNVRPVALHDPVKAVRCDLAARGRRNGQIINHKADRQSHVYREAWAMGALGVRRG